MPSILASYCCQNELLQMSCLKTIQSYLLVLGAIKVQNQVYWAKVIMSTGLVPSEGSRRKSVSLPFPSSNSALHSKSHASTPCPIFKASQCDISPLWALLPSLQLFSPWLWLYCFSLIKILVMILNPPG